MRGFKELLSLLTCRRRRRMKRSRNQNVGPRRPRHPRNNFLHVPEEIMLNIISRLPAESVLECRLVSKTWRNLPLLHDNNTYFTDIHLRRLLHNKTKLSFVFMGLNNSYRCLYYVEYDENDVNSYKKHKKIRLPITGDAMSLVGSCNGLICFAAPRTEYCSYVVFDPIYIYNPITREFVQLPSFITNYNEKHKFSFIKSGFGYHPSTNEYKVVRVIYYNLDQDPSIGQVQVYTLGSGMGWRNKGDISHRLDTNTISHGVLLDGALHWLSREGNIVAFDLADEEFHCLPVIPGSSSPHWFMRSKIWLVSGLLCVVHQNSFLNAEIWLFKKKHGTSSNDQSWSWSREFTIEFGDRYQSCELFSITKRGEILLWYKRKSIICCDPKPAAKPKKLGGLGHDITDIHGTRYHISTVLFH